MNTQDELKQLPDEYKKHALTKGATKVKQPTKKKLLKKYAEEHRKVRCFLQMDGFNMDTGVITKEPYEHSLFPGGYDLFGGKVHDLRGSDERLPVRVQIIDGADRQQVLFLLGAIRDWLIRDFDDLMGLGSLKANRQP